MDVLDMLSYDVSVITPDHYFSYLSNLTHVDASTKQIIEQARSSLLRVRISSSSHERLGKSSTTISRCRALTKVLVLILELLSHYPSSIVTLALMYAVDGSNKFIMDQMKVFLQHKHKDASHYFVSGSYFTGCCRLLTRSLLFFVDTTCRMYCTTSKLDKSMKRRW